MFGMGTGVSLAPWAPILVFLPHEPASGRARILFMLLVNRGVGDVRFLSRRTVVRLLRKLPAS